MHIRIKGAEAQVLIDRRKQIKELLQVEQQVSIREISERFNVSVATARRDLDALADNGEIERLHGGARLIGHAPPEMPSLQRLAEQSEEKQAIAAAAAQLIGDNETVFLGSGTTVLEVARRLPRRTNLTVVTNSLLVANALADRRDITLIVMGGIFRQSERSFYGHLTELMLNEISASKVIFGIRAISLERGLTNDFVAEISTDRAILKMARDVILVADHTKFNRVSTALVCSVAEVRRIVTDDQAPPDLVEALVERGIEVIVAQRLERGAD
ncbi:MAG: DeoR/GlpR family DNA-binding transcription regulator [Anaerolineae bacterium]